MCYVCACRYMRYHAENPPKEIEKVTFAARCSPLPVVSPCASLICVAARLCVFAVQPLKSPNMAEVVSQWDAEFVDVSEHTAAATRTPASSQVTSARTHCLLCLHVHACSVLVG